MSDRQRFVRLYTRHLAGFYEAGQTLHYQVLKGLPKDAEFVRVIEDLVFGELKLVFTSEEWPELETGVEIPEQVVELWDRRSR